MFTCITFYIFNIATLTNTKTEKSFKGVFGLCPKRKYSADIGIILQDNSNKRTMFKVIPTFVIRNPTTTLISLTGSADFKQDKSLKSSMSLSIAKYMNKPATIKCKPGRQYKDRTGTINFNI